MADLIDRNALYNRIVNESSTIAEIVIKNTGHTQYLTVMADRQNEILDMISEMPTIDAVPVVHGKWIPLWFDDEDKLFREAPSDYKCSACKAIVPAKQAIHENYCHICGAKMDGKGGDDAG